MTAPQVTLEVETDGDRGHSVFIVVDGEQDLTTLALGLSQILGSSTADRLWHLRDGVYQPLGRLDPPAPEPIGEMLDARSLHRVVLSEGVPAVIRGG